MSKNGGVVSGQNKLLFENKILRINDVVDILGYSKSHVYRLTSQNKIPFYKKGKTLFFMSQEIVQWVQQGAA